MGLYMDDIQRLQVTDDTLFDKHLLCRQHVEGYRFSIDPVLVAHFSPPKKTSTVLDIGAGCGIISLVLAYRFGDQIKTIHALEIQSSLFRLMQYNISANDYENIIHPVLGDLKAILQYLEPESIDHIYCNPPYFSTGSGRISKNKESYGARHQIYANLHDITAAAKKVLVNKGFVTLCYPAKQITEIFKTLSADNLEIKRMQLIYSYPEATNASLVLVEAIKNGGAECQVLPPFYVYEYQNGPYSIEMQKLYQKKES